MDDGKPSSTRKRKPNSFKKRSHSQFDSGKRKRPNSSHDYGYTLPSSSKPIDTIYRILCPIKKIGSVLGKGGEIVNTLRDETHAKIRVADTIPGSEERVIIIFSYVSKEPKGFDDDQNLDNVDLMEKESDDLQPHCPAQHALLKVHDRITADEFLRGGVIHQNNEVDDVVTARILVPSNQIGCLLGKGGTIIQKLRSHTGANIRILPAEHLPPCAMSTDELVQISGIPVVVKKALYEVSTLLHQHPHKENPPLDDLIYASTQGVYHGGAPMPLHPLQGNPMLSYQPGGMHPLSPMPWLNRYRHESPRYGHGNFNSGRSRNDAETVDEFSIRVLCAIEKIGGVIGKGGTNVRQLEQQTGARIQVEDTGPDAEERIIVVSSKEVPWDPHCATIEAVLQLLGRICATSEKNTITTRLLVPSKMVGCLLGQGGNIITEMRRRTRADIRVYSKDDKPKYTSANEELVQISGNHDVVYEALTEITSRLRARSLRDGNAHASPVPPEPFHGFAHPESIPGGGPLPSCMVGSGNSIHYEHPKIAGQALEPRGYPGPHTISAEAFSYPPAPTVQGYLSPTTATGQGYPGEPGGIGREYARQPIATGQGYLGQSTATGHGYAGQPIGTSYGYVHPQAQEYPGSPTAAWYPNMNNSVEVKIPNSAIPSVLGMGGNNLSDIRQISGARVKLHDPHSGASECVVELHGSSDQLKAAQSLLQGFIASGYQKGLPPSTQPSAQTPWAY